MTLRTYTLIILLVWALVASTTASWLYVENGRLAREVDAYKSRLAEVNATTSQLLEKVNFVTVFIDYGNGTVEVHRNVPIPKERSTVLLALLSVASVNYTVYPYGVFVDSINGVANDPESNKWWLYYVYVDGEGFVAGEVGADQKILTDRDIVSWNYTSF